MRDYEHSLIIGRVGRPPCCRRISGAPTSSVFKPAGVPARMLDEVVVTLDELESIRLADFEGLYQEQAAELMGVSRPTFGRIVEAARRKVADALVHGKLLRIAGGPIAEASCRRGVAQDLATPCRGRRWRMMGCKKT